MNELLQRLRDFIAAHPERAFFDAPATPADIATEEATIGVPLPESYRQFLLTFNGGFINISGLQRSEEDWDRGTARWNSNYIFGTKLLAKEYAQLEKLARDVFAVEGTWEFVPFCQTSGQEILVFGPRQANQDTPVLDAFHEMPPDDWSVLYPSFAHFLKAYIDGEGEASIIAGA
jgi:hypothetical protein